MTDTPPTSTVEAEDSAPGALHGSLDHLDPNSVEIENVRDAVDLTRDFLASLREHGVLVPLTAVRGDDGVVRIRNGQRRTLGAREVGLSTVPVYVLPATAGDDAAEAVERIVHQIVTNDQKDDLTDAQRTRGIQQMIDAGLSATRVAKRLSVSRDTVKAATTAAGSATAMDALSSGQLSLMEAAAITEFIEGDPAAISKLLEAAGGPQFDNTVDQLRQDRDAAKALAEAAESFAAQGYRVLDERPAWRDTSCVALRRLRTPDGQEATEAPREVATRIIWEAHRRGYSREQAIASRFALPRRAPSPQSRRALDVDVDHAIPFVAAPRKPPYRCRHRGSQGMARAMHLRARSEEAKLRRAEDLLDAARTLALDLGGVRHVTLAAVTEAAGLHPSAVRRYFDSMEELLLELAERGWRQWHDALTTQLADAHNLTTAQTAAAVAKTLAAQPLFCDLLTHVPLGLEGEVSIERARRFKTNSFAAFDGIIDAMTTTGVITTRQAQELIVAALGLAANLWQLSHPTPTLAELYEENPRWGELAVNFQPRLTSLLQAIAIGLTGTEGCPSV